MCADPLNYLLISTQIHWIIVLCEYTRTHTQTYLNSICIYIRDARRYWTERNAYDRLRVYALNFQRSYIMIIRDHII